MIGRVLTARIPKQLAEDVDDLASALERPRGWIVKQALSLYVDLERKRHALTLEALADVDAGRMEFHAEIEAWAANLAGPKKRTRKR